MVKAIYENIRKCKEVLKTIHQYKDQLRVDGQHQQDLLQTIMAAWVVVYTLPVVAECFRIATTLSNVASKTTQLYAIPSSYLTTRMFFKNDKESIHVLLARLDVCAFLKLIQALLQDLCVTNDAMMNVHSTLADQNNKQTQPSCIESFDGCSKWYEFKGDTNHQSMTQNINGDTINQHESCDSHHGAKMDAPTTNSTTAPNTSTITSTSTSTSTTYKSISVQQACMLMSETLRELQSILSMIQHKIVHHNNSWMSYVHNVSLEIEQCQIQSVFERLVRRYQWLVQLLAVSSSPLFVQAHTSTLSYNKIK